MGFIHSVPSFRPVRTRPLPEGKPSFGTAAAMQPFAFRPRGLNHLDGLLRAQDFRYIATRTPEKVHYVSQSPAIYITSTASRLMTSIVAPVSLNPAASSWPKRVDSRSASTLRRILLVDSRTASLRPLPSCRYRLPRNAHRSEPRRNTIKSTKDQLGRNHVAIQRRKRPCFRHRTTEVARQRPRTPHRSGLPK